MGDVTGSPLGISAELWTILACPCDAHGALEPDLGTGEIVCTVCARRYPVRDGIPVMLMDEARSSLG
jgi:uncharacterized protein YbaR (Trm112 family)